MVTTILGMIAGGYSLQRVLDTYPELKREDVTAALDYVAQVIDEEKVLPHLEPFSVLRDQNNPPARAT